jgi:lysophospholipase L1-like esterase
VAGEPSLNQGDGIHPLAEGYRIVAEKVCPYVLQAIKKKARVSEIDAPPNVKQWIAVSSKP